MNSYHGASFNGIDQNGAGTSAINFRAQEDLGGGMKALFVLEQGISIDNGTSSAGRTFGRQAFVGLSGVPGTLTMGRQYTPLDNAYGVVDPFGNNTAGDIKNIFGKDADFQTRDFRMDNAVVYMTPANLGGFNASAAYSFGEQAGDVHAQSQTGFSVGYAGGPLNLVYAWHEANIDQPPVYTPAYRSQFVGGTYDFSVLKLHAAISQTSESGMHKIQSYLIGATVPLGKHALVADYIYRENKLLADANVAQVALGYNYVISKRTNLYVVLARTANDRYSAENTPPDNPQYGKSVQKYQMGIRHVF